MFINILSMLLIIALLFSTSLCGAEEGGWEVKATEKGVTVQARAHSGSEIQELKATGVIEAPPKVLFQIITDYGNYKAIMPYTEESKIVASEDGGKTVHLYSVINAPLVARRDYTIRIVDDSDWREGTGFLKISWTISEKGPAPVPNIVRVKVDNGSWLLEPLEHGAKTKATYFLYTNPGGTLPVWISNKANSSTIPDVFEALRKEARIRFVQ